MTNLDRSRLRMKQDFLLMLAVDMCHYDESLRVDEKQSAPILSALRTVIHPEWEFAIDSQIQSLADKQYPKISIPDFNKWASQLA